MTADVLLWAFHFGYFVYRNVGNLETQVPLRGTLETFRHLESPVPLKILANLFRNHVHKDVLDRGLLAAKIQPYLSNGSKDL